MSANETARPDDATVAEYVLGTLPHAERVAFEKLLRDDAVLRKAVADWSNRLAPLADEIEAVEPPAAFAEHRDRLADARGAFDDDGGFLRACSPGSGRSSMMASKIALMSSSGRVLNVGWILPAA